MRYQVCGRKEWKRHCVEVKEGGSEGEGEGEGGRERFIDGGGTMIYEFD